MHLQDCCLVNNHVSLFTREWIEIYGLYPANPIKSPSPSLRGSGLKWYIVRSRHRLIPASPSLRGSGLKSLLCGQPLPVHTVSLFTREWIEITSVKFLSSCNKKSPSLRGSGLKSLAKSQSLQGLMSPSLRGSGLK